MILSNCVFGWCSSGTNITHDLQAPSGWLTGSFTDPSYQTSSMRIISHKMWSTFILDKPQGFMQARIESFNHSIQTYVWAILGAQAQTRSNILAVRTRFDTQKQFLANLEVAISSPWRSLRRSLATRVFSEMPAPKSVTCLGMICTWPRVICNFIWAKLRPTTTM